jgi:hypothetical protein
MKNKTFVKTIFILLLSHTIFAEAKFYDSHQRYLTSIDLIRYLNAKFNIPQMKFSYYNDCERLNFTDHIILGSVLPKQGKSLVNKPDESYNSWVLNCVVKLYENKMDYTRYLVSENNEEVVADFKLFFGDRLWTKFRNYKDRVLPDNQMLDLSFSINFNNDENMYYTHPLKHSLEKVWSLLDESTKKEVTESVLIYFLGPEKIIETLGFFGENTFMLGQPKTLDDLVEIYLNQEVMRDPFITIEDALKYITIFIFNNNVIYQD